MIAAALILASLTSQPEVFVQKIPGTIVTLRLVRVPDGEFESGGKKQKIENLWVAETETSWDLYDVFAFRLDLPPNGEYDKRSRPSMPYGAPDHGFGHAGYPAICMSQGGARRFCEWLSQQTGKTYRLPTETEWEYFARAGAKSTPDIEKSAWVWENSDDKSQPMGKKAPNAWGLYDTLGNVSEWITGTEGPTTAGGSWKDKKATVDFATRAKQTPAWNLTDPQNPKSRWWLPDANFVGFRVVTNDAP
jgi:formylglycine-generating enzyme required for sulfatase activity